jgi:putative Holliday junction resolvase
MIPGSLMAFDIGDVRTGVAVTDAMQIITSPLRTITMSGNLAKDAAELVKVIDEIGPVTVVAGIPLNQHGEPGPQAAKVSAMLDAMRARTSVPIVTIDERFSTAEAQRYLRAANVKGKKQRATIDQVSAVLILETYQQRERNRVASQS